MSERFDVVFIGGGPAGYVGAIRGAQLGGKVAVVEKDALGGVCLNRGCIPTKALAASAQVLDSCRSAVNFGIDVPGEVTADLARIMARKDKIVRNLVKGIETLFRGHGITLFRGQGAFVEAKRLAIRGKHGAQVDIETNATVIATGSSPANIPTFPINGGNILSSDHLFKLNRLPESILIIGAGAIGCEWAFILNALGVEVTLIEMMARAAPLEDEDISVILEREMKKRKIRLITGERILSLGEDMDNQLVAQTEGGKEIRMEKALVCIGRSRNTSKLNLESIGVKIDSKGCVIVNERMETGVAGIYAAGDVVDSPLLAHVAFAEGKAAAANALGGSETMDYSVIPSAMFTFPEVAGVGLREQEAKERGIDYQTAKFPFRALGKAHVEGRIAGEVKLVAESGSGRLLGAHIIGPGASVLVHEAALAINMQATADDLARTIHAHPTLSEAVEESAEALLGRAIHIAPSLTRK